MSFTDGAPGRTLAPLVHRDRSLPRRLGCDLADGSPRDAGLAPPAARVLDRARLPVAAALDVAAGAQRELLGRAADDRAAPARRGAAGGGGSAPGLGLGVAFDARPPGRGGARPRGVVALGLADRPV